MPPQQVVTRRRPAASGARWTQRWANLMLGASPDCHIALEMPTPADAGAELVWQPLVTERDVSPG